jgi:hypothetical protein
MATPRYRCLAPAPRRAHSRAEFAALESALLEELRPGNPLETLLARRLIAAAWRLARADRLEFEMLVGGDPHMSPGGALTRDGGAERAFATLVRYRNGAQAEFFRVLKALQARAPAAKPDAASRGVDEAPTPALRPAAPRATRDPLPRPDPREVADEAEPHTFGLRRDSKAPRNEPERTATGHQCAVEATRNEPERPPIWQHPAASAGRHEQGEAVKRAEATRKTNPSALRSGIIRQRQRLAMNSANRSSARLSAGRLAAKQSRR